LDCDYKLVVHSSVFKPAQTEEKDSQGDRIRFQFNAYHPSSKSVDGILNEEMKYGNSLYLSEQLLEYLHYEAGQKDWKDFFAFNIANLKS
jgi:hypothetical protein